MGTGQYLFVKSKMVCFLLQDTHYDDNLKASRWRPSFKMCHLLSLAQISVDLALFTCFYPGSRGCRDLLCHLPIGLTGKDGRIIGLYTW